MVKFVKHFMARMVVAFLLLQYGTAVLAVGDVLIVTSKDTKPYQVFVDSVRDRLSAYGISPSVLTSVSLSDFNEDVLSRDAEKKFSLVIAVGSKSAISLARLHSAVPVLCAMLPKSVFDSLKGDYEDGENFSAIYIDQPESRVFDLIQVALPSAKKVGLLVSNKGRYNDSSLINKASSRLLRLETGYVEDSNNVVSILNEVLARSDVLLTLPDPVVLNSKTVQSVLLTAYMRKIPVISYSPAYVRAGALMAVYSSPAELGRHVAEKLVGLDSRNYKHLDKPEYPKYFSVALNERVARSLGIVIPDADTAKNMLIELSGNQL